MKEFNITIVSNDMYVKEVTKAREIIENFFQSLIQTECPNTTIIVRQTK